MRQNMRNNGVKTESKTPFLDSVLTEEKEALFSVSELSKKKTFLKQNNQFYCRPRHSPPGLGKHST